MTPTSQCPQCGAAISDRSAHRLCPKCLLAAGLGQGPGALSAVTEAYAMDEALGWSMADLENRFPQLEILDLIGRGGMGAVYRARQKTLDRIVALKVLPARASRDPSFAERFVREARTMAKLNHPSVVTLHEFGEHDGLYYLLMEYVDGANLRSLMNEGSLQSNEALSIVGQVCDALQYAHEMGIVHRDIKPENVLIDQRGQVKIADFGLAKILAKPPTDVTLTGVHQVVGTPHYMAPEQMEKPTEVDHRADIYSLGVVFYELLTGELPLGRFAKPSEKAAIDANLDEVVLRTLEKEPANRYQSAVAMKSDCTRYAGERVHAAERNVEAESVEPRDAKPHSLSFTLPSGLEGIYDYVGFLKLEGGKLTLQYRGQESFMGSSLGGTQEHVFPLSKLDSMEVKYGIGGPMMLLTPNDLKVANKVPGMEKGKIRLKFDRQDRKKAESLVRACGDRSSVDAIIPTPPTHAEAMRDLRAPAIAILIYAIVCIMISLISSGTALADGFDGDWIQTFVLGGSTISTLMNIFVIFGAIHMYFASHRGVSFGAAICCCIPTGPASAAGIGLGIWALIVLNREETTELFERNSDEERPPHFGFVDPDSGGKPASREVMRQDAAARLRTPLAALRVCGWVSLIGLLAALGYFSLTTDWSVINVNTFGLYPWWSYVLVALLVNGCGLAFVRTDQSRASIITICIIAALPISLVWPLAISFAVWALLVLLDPDVREVHEEENLPPATPSPAVKIAAMILFSIIIPIGLTYWLAGFETAPLDPSSIEWRFADQAGEDLDSSTHEVFVRKLNDRLDDTNVPASVRVEEDEPLVKWKRRNAINEHLDLFQRMAANGRIEVALLRDADDDAQGAIDSASESDDLRYGLAGAASPAGLRIAVVRDTRLELAINDLDSWDLSERHGRDRKQDLELELNDASRPKLTKQLKRILSKRSSESRPLHLALIVDNVVYATCKTVVNDQRPFDTLKFTGVFPWTEEKELDAVLNSGPLGGQLVRTEVAKD